MNTEAMKTTGKKRHLVSLDSDVLSTAKYCGVRHVTPRSLFRCHNCDVCAVSGPVISDQLKARVRVIKAKNKKPNHISKETASSKMIYWKNTPAGYRASRSYRQHCWWCLKARSGHPPQRHCVVSFLRRARCFLVQDRSS